MEPFAKQVKLLGVDEIATFFAAQKREPSPGKPDRAAIERGRAASAACAACHGPEGQGDAPKLVPAIAGQPTGYIRNQLLLFKADKRSPGDPALTQLKSVLRSILRRDARGRRGVLLESEVAAVVPPERTRA
jgi:cytochrome c553